MNIEQYFKNKKYNFQINSMYRIMFDPIRGNKLISFLLFLNFFIVSGHFFTVISSENLLAFIINLLFFLAFVYFTYKIYKLNTNKCFYKNINKFKIFFSRNTVAFTFDKNIIESIIHISTDQKAIFENIVKILSNTDRWCYYFSPLVESTREISSLSLIWDSTIVFENQSDLTFFLMKLPNEYSNFITLRRKK